MMMSQLEEELFVLIVIKICHDWDKTDTLVASCTCRSREKATLVHQIKQCVTARYQP